MPRLARLDAPGVLHHVIIREIERRKYLRTIRTRIIFLTAWEPCYLKQKQPAMHGRCYLIMHICCSEPATYLYQL